MESSLDQRYAIKFCSKLNKSFAETHKLIVQAYGDSTLSYSQVSRWLKAFKEGREEVVDEPRAGRPSTSTTDDNLARGRDLLNSDRRLSVWMIAETLNIPKTIVHELMTDKLDMRKVCAWELHHDNAPSHTALRVREYQAKHKLTTLLQPPYSPDMAPADFFLFPRIKTVLKGIRFGSTEAIQDAVTRALAEVPVEAFQDAYRAWQSRWKKCVDAQGNYFEEY